jgi:hypothetical protein
MGKPREEKERKERTKGRGRVPVKTIDGHGCKTMGNGKTDKMIPKVVQNYHYSG